VDATGQEPWHTVFTIGTNENTVVHPILVPKTPAHDLLTGDGAQAGLDAIAATKLPTETDPLVLGCANIYVSDNRIIAAPGSDASCPAPEFLCSEGSCGPTIVFSPKDTPSAVIAFPDRTDALVVAAGQLVFVIAIDPREPQFFAPLLKGTNLGIAPATPTSIYVGGEGKVFSVPL
jgi:hypothetical protein